MTTAADRTASPRIAFKSHLRVEVAPGEAVYLVSERGVTALHGAPITVLAPLLDGTRDLPAILRETAATLPAPAVRRMIERLGTAGLLHHRTGPAASRAAEAYWELAGLDVPRAQRAGATGTVRAVVLDGTDPGETARTLATAGLTLVDADADLTVVLTADYLSPDLAEVDAAQRAAGRPWLLAKPGGTTPLIGPVLRPGEGACWHCLAERLGRNRQADAHVGRVLGQYGPVVAPEASLPASRAAALQLTALEAAKWLAGHRYPGQDALWSLDTLGLDGGHHPVARRPQCPACGDPGLTAGRVLAPVRLRGRPATHTDAGGHRHLGPQEVLDRYGHLVDPLTGLVQEIRRDTRGPEFLNCFHAGHNPVAATGTLAQVRAGLRSTSSGKGITPLHARVSALCEALERHSGHHQGDEPTIRGSYRALAEEAVHPDAVQLYDPLQYPDRAAWNAANSPFHHVGDPFDERAEVDWTPLWSLTGQRRRLLPTALLYYGAPQARGHRFCHANSNGTAAGGSLEDAVLQGFLELVERDAVALWWYNRTRQPGVRAESFDDPWLTECAAVHTRLDRSLWALDLTSDLGIPVFAALSRRTDKPAEDIVLGFGAHLDPRIALRRAFTEVNQMLPSVVDARPDGGGYSCTDPVPLAWWQGARAEEHPYLLPDPVVAARTPADHPYRPKGDLKAEVDGAVELLRGHGLELLVLDQTRPDIGLPVVRVVVPGLRPHFARFAPGRLFDAPVRLGRLAAPTPYGELNPVPLFV
ncbi:TOMM precursor leader peptide-binding protein [Kitasatospora sp. NPDC087314]|uniref:TOMM precursor leader peptide-binding protein n=1 Tax=Kitasatospora sp. NPDC087314 TaxID=3364068 RepID=UPI003828759A